MLQSSGTVAQTEVSVETLVRHALRRCGKLPSTIGGELLSEVREALYLMIAELANDGINLWCLQKSILAVGLDQKSYVLPTGVNDVVNCLYRTLENRATAWEVADSYVIADLGESIAPTNLACTFNAASQIALAIDHSEDASDPGAWVPFMTLAPMSVIAGALLTLDFDNPKQARYWRLRDVNGANLNVTEPRFRRITDELTMAKLNRDDYTNLPNKTYGGQKALQFWFDKQINPRLWVWPIPNQPLDQIVVWAAQQIQDPGSLTNSLAVPTRWYQAILDMLAYRASFYVPRNEMDPQLRNELAAVAADSRTRASNGESDGSAFRLAPRIGVYTA